MEFVTVINGMIDESAGLIRCKFCQSKLSPIEQVGEDGPIRFYRRECETCGSRLIMEFEQLSDNRWQATVTHYPK